MSSKIVKITLLLFFVNNIVCNPAKVDVQYLQNLGYEHEYNDGGENSYNTIQKQSSSVTGSVHENGGSSSTSNDKTLDEQSLIDDSNAEIIHQRNGKPIILYANSASHNNKDNEHTHSMSDYKESNYHEDGGKYENGAGEYNNYNEYYNNNNNHYGDDYEHDGKTKICEGKTTHKTYGNSETIVHRPATIVVRRPPTQLIINHKPIVIKRAPVVIHRPATLVKQPIIHKHLPRTVHVRPVTVKVIKPIEKKIVIDRPVKPKVLVEKQPERKYYIPAKGCDKHHENGGKYSENGNGNGEYNEHSEYNSNYDNYEYGKY